MSQRPKVQQLELFADTMFFSILRTMVFNGDLGKMGFTAFGVYVVIKAHAHFHTGLAFPALETIAELGEISTDTVSRAIKKLEHMGYLQKVKKGRLNHYTLLEQVPIQDADGNLARIGTFPYRPSANKANLKQLQNYIETGEHNGAITINVVNIDKQYIQINNGGENVQLNIDDIKDPQLKRQIHDFYERHQKTNNLA